jgi:spectinomycin phosphotransferase
MEHSLGMELIERVRREFGLDLSGLDPVTHGADDNARMWRANDGNGGRYAVKLSGGGTPAGLIVTDHLARRGVPGIARPVPARDGRPWADVDGVRLSIVPWVSDEQGWDGGMGADHWRSYGELLAMVHATPVTDELRRLLPTENHTHDSEASLVQEVERRLREPAVDALHRALADEWAAEPIRALLAYADTFAPALGAEAAPTVVCHGDPHLGNVLLGPNGTVWLIDWDDAVLAPPERDLMFVTGGVLAFAPVGPDHAAWFFEGYGPAAPDRRRLAYYLCVRALFDIADFARHVTEPDRPEQDRVRALAIVRGLLSPTGMVAIARQAADLVG